MESEITVADFRARASESSLNAVALPGLADEHSELSLNELWRVIVKRKLLIASFVVVVFSAVSAYTFHKTRLYEASAQIEIDPNRSTNLGLDLVEQKLGSMSDTDAVIQTEVKILQSNSLAATVIDKTDWATKHHYIEKYRPVSELAPYDRENILASFADQFKVQVVPNSQIVGVGFRDSDPELATKVTNQAIDTYIERNFSTRYQGTMQVSDWLSKQMDGLNSRAIVAQQKLAEFQKQNNILGTDESDNIITERLKELNQQLTEAEADRIVKEARYRLATSGNPELIGSLVPSTSLQVLRTQQSELKTQYAQVSTKFGAGYPKVSELQGQLQKVDEDIAAEVQVVGQRIEQEYRAAKSTEGMLRESFEAQKQAAYKLNENATDYSLLKHEVESSRELYDSLQLKLNEAGVTAGLNSTNITVVDHAQVPGRPVSPRVPLNLALGLLGGLVGGIALAFVADSMDDTIQTSDEVERASGLPTLSIIPVFSRKSLKRRNSTSLSQSVPRVLMLENPKSSSAEAYRTLRSSILLSSMEHPPKVIVLTSAFPKEGKSTTSANMAITLAQRGSRVLLVDADLRRSTIAARFGVNDESGLSTLLRSSSEQVPFVSPVADVPTLSILPAGPSPEAPAELLSSPRMRQLLRDWSQQFDHIVIDTPPIFPVADALVLASQADYVVLVVRSGVTRKKALVRMRETLERTHANLGGVVLNGVDLRMEHYYSGTYGYSNAYAKGYSVEEN